MGLAKERALAIRERLDLQGWIPSHRLPDIAELCRVPVRRWPLAGPPGVYLGGWIVIESDLPQPTIRWTFAHELAHHLFDLGNDLIQGDWVAKAKRERRAEMFASYLLMGETPPGWTAWQLASHYELPVERVARALDLQAGWLAISSPEGDIARYRRRYWFAA